MTARAKTRSFAPRGHFPAGLAPLGLTLAIAVPAWLAIGTVPAMAQSSTVKESDKLLQDILRKRKPAKGEPKRKKKAAPGKKQKARKKRTGGTGAPRGGRFAGRWTMKAVCGTGTYTIKVNLTRASGSRVAGTTSSTSGFSTNILGGKVSGNSIRFRRRTAKSIFQVTDTVSGKLTGPGRMAGTITGGITKCKFTARR